MRIRVQRIDRSQFEDEERRVAAGGATESPSLRHNISTCMLQFAQKLMGKPSDTKIRAYRVVFALVLIALIYFGWNDTYVLHGLPKETQYALYFFPLVGLVRGIFDPGFFRKKVWKWVVFGLGLAMFIISLFFIEDVDHSATVLPESTESGAIDVNNLQVSDTGFSVSTDNWFGVLGFFVAVLGYLLNGKNITRKNERYGEKVTKIRV